MEVYRDALDNRFEFRQSGSFSMRSSFARGYCVIIICAAIFLSFAFPFFLIWMTGIGFKDEHVWSFFGYYMLTSGVSVVIIWAIALILINIIRKGYKCSYSADEKSLKLFSKWRSAEYKYEDVRYVTYLPMRSFGKMIGYEVTIQTRNGTDEYIYLSPFKGETIKQENTPFYILQHPPAPYEPGKEYDDIGIVF
ncbi:MAG: hypothetical protein J1E39_07220 [Eubacterium sp.]|nr:hypothetical protein [Eubacterium sp.]